MKDNYYLGLLAAPLLLSFLTIQGYLSKLGFLYISISIFLMIFIIFTVRVVINFKNFKQEFMILLYSLPFVGSLFITQLYLINLIGLQSVKILLISFLILFTLFSIIGFTLLYKHRPEIVKNKHKTPNYWRIGVIYSLLILTATFLPELFQSSSTPIKIFPNILVINLSFTIIVISYLLLSIYLINNYSTDNTMTQEMFMGYGVIIMFSIVTITALSAYHIPNLEEYIIANYNTLQYILPILMFMFLISVITSELIKVYSETDIQKGTDVQNN